MNLYINACVRSNSRTEKLATEFLSKLPGEVTEVKLKDISFPVTDESYLTRRDRLINAGALHDEMFALARQFAAADRIVIAAPYWDLSFPASLKQYFECINVTGITFNYTPEGYPQGLCKAGQLYYITTAGGNYVPEEFGFGYVKALAQGFYGIQEVKMLMAKGLDIEGADVEKILDECRNYMNDMSEI